MRSGGSAKTYSNATLSLMSNVGNGAIFFDHNGVSTVAFSVGNHEGMILGEEALSITEEKLLNLSVILGPLIFLLIPYDIVAGHLVHLSPSIHDESVIVGNESHNIDALRLESI